MPNCLAEASASHVNRDGRFLGGALRLVAYADFGDGGIIVRSNYRDAVITRINRKN